MSAPRLLGLWLPWAAFAFIVIAWVAYWFAVSAGASAQLDKAIAAHKASGGRAGYERREISGFPLRLRVRLDGNVHYASADAAWELVTERLDVHVNLSNPMHVMIAPGAAIQMRKANGDALLIAPRDGQASLRFARNGLARASIVAEDVTLTDSRGPAHSSRLASLVAHARPDVRDAKAMQVPIEITDWVWTAAPKGFEGFGARVSQARVAVVVEQYALLGAGEKENPFSAWSAAGAEARIEQSEVVWGPMRAAMTGPLSLDGQRRPTGSLTLDFAEPAKAIEAFAQSSYANDSTRRGLRLLALGQAASGATTFKTRLDARDGWWRLGPAPIWPAKPIDEM